VGKKKIRLRKRDYLDTLGIQLEGTLPQILPFESTNSVRGILQYGILEPPLY